MLWQALLMEVSTSRRDTDGCNPYFDLPPPDPLSQ
jgi:hypothetical protein